MLTKVCGPAEYFCINWQTSFTDFSASSTALMSQREPNGRFLGEWSQVCGSGGALAVMTSTSLRITLQKSSSGYGLGNTIKKFSTFTMIRLMKDALRGHCHHIQTDFQSPNLCSGSPVNKMSRAWQWECSTSGDLPPVDTEETACRARRSDGGAKRRDNISNPF